MEQIEAKLFLLEKIEELIPECESAPGVMAESCTTFPITKLEDERIKRFCRENKIPYRNLMKNKKGCKKCPYLDRNNSCTIYKARPSACKLFGVTINSVKFNPNPKFCLTNEELAMINTHIENLSEVHL